MSVRDKLSPEARAAFERFELLPERAQLTEWLRLINSVPKPDRLALLEEMDARLAVGIGARRPILVQLDPLAPPDRVTSVLRTWSAVLDVVRPYLGKQRVIVEILSDAEAVPAELQRDDVTIRLVIAVDEQDGADDTGPNPTPGREP